MTCAVLLGDDFHPCGKPVKAVWSNPVDGEWPMCARHDLRAQCVVVEQGIRRFAGWTRSEASQSVTQPRGASQAVGAVR